MISGTLLLSLLIQLVIVGAIFGLVLWYIGFAGTPEPVARVIKLIAGLFLLIFLINVLLTFTGHPFVRWP